MYQQNYFYTNQQHNQGYSSSYQKQIFQQQSQFSVYLQYTIDTDMQNVLGVCMDYLALQETQPNNYELLSVFKNRMILQLNLSNTIHLDLQENAQQIGSKEYKSLKDDAKNKFAAVFTTLSSKFRKPQQNEALQMLQDHLSYNLASNTRLKQQELEENGVKYQFGEKVVQQLITAMQYQDQQYTNLQNQKSYRSVSQQDLYSKAESRFHQAKEKIRNSGVQQRQLMPENYPDGVKQLLGTYRLILTENAQYRNQLEREFKETLQKLRQQKSGLAVSCLIDFASKLYNNQMKNEIQRWIDWMSNEFDNPITFQFNIQLDQNDLRQFAQFGVQSKGLAQDYGQKKSIVEAVQLVLAYALSVISPQYNKQQFQNPLQMFDLSVKDQISQQFQILEGQFKSQFMKQFCRDIANQRVVAYQYRYEQGIEDDIAVLRRLSN